MEVAGRHSGPSQTIRSLLRFGGLIRSKIVSGDTGDTQGFSEYTVDIEPCLALCKGQIVGRNSYGVAILLVPFPDPMRQSSCNLVIEEGNSGGASEP